MASVTWIGGASTQALVRTATLGGTWESNDTVTWTLMDETGATLATLQTAAGSTTISTICTTLATAWNASTDAYISTITAAAGATTVTFTADTAGTVFYLSVVSNENGGGAADDQTISLATTTANKGPNDWHTAANWTGGAVPSASDSVYIDGTSSYSILYGLYQNASLTLNSSVTLTLLKIERGAPQIGTLLAGLTYKMTTLDVGADPGDGGRTLTSSTIWHIKPGDVAVAATVRSTNRQGSSGKAPLLLDIDNSSATVRVLGQSVVGLATAIQGETSSIGTLTVQDQATVTAGAGLTLAILKPELGTVTLNGAVADIHYGKGIVNVNGAGGVSGEAVVGGTLNWDSSGTVAQLTIDGAGRANFYRGTITNGRLYGESAYLDAAVSGTPAAVTATNAIKCLNGARTRQVDFGDNRAVQQSAP